MPSLLLLIDCCIRHEGLKELNSTMLENRIELECHRQNSWRRVYLSVCLFFRWVFSTQKYFSVTFRFVSIYSDIQIILCQLFRHPQNWRYPSASQHEIPGLTTTFTEYFQTFDTYISLLTSALELVIIFDTTSVNKCNKSPLRYYPPYDSRHDKTAFFGSRKRKMFTIFHYKSESKDVIACRELRFKRDAESRNSLCKFCDCFGILRSAKFSEPTK